MCPPVSVRPGRDGVSHLFASWRYQLQHGDQLRICFTCFKFVFLSFKESLESEDWEDEDWEPELAENPAEGPGWGQALGQPAPGASADWGWDTPMSSPDESADGGLDQYLVPTELSPQDAAPLGLGPEDADWTQGLPWRFGGIVACGHWPSPYLLWQAFLKEVLPPGEPMLLELGTTRAVDPAEAEAWLLDMQVLSTVNDSDATYLRNMTALWALRTPGQGWNVLLEPDDVCGEAARRTPGAGPGPVEAEHSRNLRDRRWCRAGSCGHSSAEEGVQHPLLLSLEQKGGRGERLRLRARVVHPRGGSQRHWDRQHRTQGDL